jgi:hypothetical protein
MSRAQGIRYPASQTGTVRIPWMGELGADGLRGGTVCSGKPPRIALCAFGHQR